MSKATAVDAILKDKACIRAIASTGKLDLLDIEDDPDTVYLVMSETCDYMRALEYVKSGKYSNKIIECLYNNLFNENTSKIINPEGVIKAFLEDRIVYTQNQGKEGGLENTPPIFMREVARPDFNYMADRLDIICKYIDLSTVDNEGIPLIRAPNLAEHLPWDRINKALPPTRRLLFRDDGKSHECAVDGMVKRSFKFNYAPGEKYHENNFGIAATVPKVVADMYSARNFLLGCTDEELSKMNMNTYMKYNILGAVKDDWYPIIMHKIAGTEVISKINKYCYIMADNKVANDIKEVKKMFKVNSNVICMKSKPDINFDPYHMLKIIAADQHLGKADIE